MNPPTLTPLFWQGTRLVPQATLDPLDASACGTLTILHTNDFHSSVDARPGNTLGGLARIATTIERARTAGPTLVADAGDSVYGGGTWWCANGAGATGRLLGVAGYDLAAIGNHDLERGPDGLRELLQGGRRLVSTNLVFEDQDLQDQIAPAYVVSVDGLQIGVLGLTTRMTQSLVPGAVLRGVRFSENTLDALLRAVAELSPLVHSIVILSHLGFDYDEGSDIHIIPALRNSKVTAILGGHTHAALDPAPVIDGITTCNAGAHGINVNKVTLTRNEHGSIEVRAQLLPQDQSVPEHPRLVEARASELRAILPLREEQVRVPALTIAASASLPGLDKEREWALLTMALRASGNVAAEGIQMVPYLYVLGELPHGETISHLEVLTAYPNSERLMQIELTGADLKRLIELQPQLARHCAAIPVWLEGGQAVSPVELEDERRYPLVVSELVSEGGLGWTLLQHTQTQVRPLGFTCADLVWDYLARLESSGVAPARDSRVAQAVVAD